MPFRAKPLKHILHMLNLRIKALGLPQRGQRLRVLTLNLGFEPIFTNLHFFDIVPLVFPFMTS